MPDVMHFYMDDSGTRQPDRNPGRKPAHGYDWFALGGVLVRQEDEAEVREAHNSFMTQWGSPKPLHSTEIRARSQGYHWLNKIDKTEQIRFYEELYQMMTNTKLIGHACVIDRPGYNGRYYKKHGKNRWDLCQTAFKISVERAAKFARSQNCKLKVFVERSDKKTEARLKLYYIEMKTTGMPFSEDNSSQYNPLSAESISETLYDFKIKNKTSPIMQLADLYLWPICMGGYNDNNRPYKRLINDARLIDCHIDNEQISALGIKYSCFD